MTGREGMDDVERGAGADLASALMAANLIEFHQGVGLVLTDFAGGHIEAEEAVNRVAELFVDSAVANKRVWEGVDGR